MPNQVLSSVENNFTKGLITEFTGLNFPENAATDCDNCEFTLVGDVLRRLGIDYETNHGTLLADRTGSAVSTYKWNNAGGSGNTEVVVSQIGTTLYFYKSSVATDAAPLSDQLLPSTVDVSSFVSSGGIFDPSLECQFTDGNGYLFVFHPSCDPFYCAFSPASITATKIDIKIRDFAGVLDTSAPSTTTRPTSLTNEHNYNLQNQGWNAGNPWSVQSSTPNTVSLGSHTWTVPSGMSAVNGDGVNVYVRRNAGIGNYEICMSGTITSYVGTSMTLSVISAGIFGSFTFTDFILTPTNVAYIATWFTAEGNYPSNADVWWYFKDTTGTFNPATTVPKVSVGSGNAPRGHFLLDAFNQQRSTLSGVASITDVTTTVRPRTGTWFQGRVWYTGVDASQAASGDADNYSWSENIYFSQIAKTPADFGSCYQVNDPTAETLFDLLPSDGGVITIQGCGSIYKLFPMQNALLIFAANGVWYLTGSQGIGFTANDYTIVKLSAVRSISGHSFVDVNGLPYFWNEEGIYSVEPAKQGTSLLNSPLHVNPLEVIPLTVGTILTFYNSIPASSKRYARGAYNPIEYVIQWIYKDTEAADTTDRYQFNKILNFNTSNKAFFPYTINSSNSRPATINSILYVSNPGSSLAPDPTFKYLSSNLLSPVYSITFADEHDETYVDWNSVTAVNYDSFFVTGYKLHGQGQRRFQIPYLYLYSRTLNGVGYKIQSLWDYATSGNSGRWSSIQVTNIPSGNFAVVAKRHKLRGQGLTLQIKVSSIDGTPFDIMGWSSFETQNTGV